MDLLNGLFTLIIYNDIYKPFTQPCEFYSYFSCTLPFYFINDPTFLEPSHENLYTKIVIQFRNSLIIPRPWHGFSNFRQTLKFTLKILMLTYPLFGLPFSHYFLILLIFFFFFSFFSLFFHISSLL
jgi:hypothetical protein